MGYPADTPEWDHLVRTMEDHGFKREAEDDDMGEQWWERPADRVAPGLMVDDNVAAPGELGLWHAPPGGGEWVLLFQGGPAAVATRIAEELDWRNAD